MRRDSIKLGMTKEKSVNPLRSLAKFSEIIGTEVEYEKSVNPHNRPLFWIQCLLTKGKGHNPRSLNGSPSQGFALPISIGLGLVMAVMGVTAIMVAQNDRTTAFQRRETNASIAATEGGIARSLAQLLQDNNIVLLTRNYDTINPTTNTTYLGPDGIPNSGDEETNEVDEWTGYSPGSPACASGVPISAPSLTLDGTMGQTDDTKTKKTKKNKGKKTDPKVPDTGSSQAEEAGLYTIKAYRYNSSKQTGTLLVEGQQGGSKSYIAVTMSVQSVPFAFPGVLVSETLALRGRSLLGSNGNAYYSPQDSLDPNLTDSAAPLDPARAAYLNAIYSSPLDGPGGDRVSGAIVACQLALSLDGTVPATVTSLGTIQGDMALSNAGSPYHAAQINLNNNETITVDTTAGPVYLYYSGMVSLRNNAKILNIRTDGHPPQVGDLRIIADQDVAQNVPFALYDQSCVSTAFLYSRTNTLDLLTTGDGCPSNGETNFDGVIWAEDIVSSVNIDPNPHNVPSGGDSHPHFITTAGSTSGIAVPDDVSSLSDTLTSLGLTPDAKLGYVEYWQYVRY